MKKILVTGGAGFIGSHVVRHFVKKYPNYMIINLDALSYAGNLENLREVEKSKNYRFIKGDICDLVFLSNLFAENSFDAIIHLAAESHVDRSINNPLQFVYTNVIGTVNLLELFKKVCLEDSVGKLFYHISTDEVYGSLGETGFFVEETPYAPNSPYSASKASSDHFVRAYYETYGLPVIISNCSNNYGANQFPEKLIPLCISNILEGKSLPIYGDGNYTRDWLYVQDHVEAIDLIFHQGRKGETYNVGGFNEIKNIDLVNEICRQMDIYLGNPRGSSSKLITFVKDRLGHDFRYAIDPSKIERELKWKPKVTFEEGLKATIDWYMKNTDWLDNVRDGSYMNYCNKEI